MPKIQKKVRKKVKSRQVVRIEATPRVLWSMLISVVGISLIIFLLIWFVLPNVLPVKRSLVAIMSQSDPRFILLVGLDEDPKLRQAVLFELNQDQQQQLLSQNLVAIDVSLQLMIDQLIVIDGNWPDIMNSTLVADTIRSEISQRLPTIDRETMQLLASWYLIQRGEEFSVISESNLLATELQKDWGSVLTVGDDCQLAILNSTDQSGLAGDMTQLVENNGGLVIRLKQYPEQLDKTVIYLDETQPACAAVAEKVEKLFSPKPGIHPMTNAESSYRAPLVVILGNDYLEQIN